MSSRMLYRLSAIALISGGILFLLGYGISSLLPIQGHIYANPLFVPAELLQMYGTILLLIGLPGIVVRLAQAQRGAKLAVVGFVITFLGLVTTEVGMTSISAFIFPLFATHPGTQSLAGSPAGISLVWFLLGLISTLFGALLLGIAIVRTRILPRLAGVLLIIAAPFVFISLIDDPLVAAITGIIFAVALGLGFAWSGYSLLFTQEEEEKQSSLATPSSQKVLAMNGHSLASDNHRNLEIAQRS